MRNRGHSLREKGRNSSRQSNGGGGGGEVGLGIGGEKDPLG